MRLELEVLRGDAIESRHRAFAVVLDAADQPLHESQRDDAPVFWRSASKPFQALPFVQSGAIERFGLPDEALALACGSHSGGPEHTAVAAAVLERIGARVDDLFCGPHMPSGEAEARATRFADLTRLHNNCSGKHAAMLAACRARGYPLAGYQAPDHPLQREIFAALCATTGALPSEVGVAIDGCGAATFQAPLLSLARGFRRFVAGALPSPYQDGVRLRDAVLRHPRMIAGGQRFCTALLEATSGRVLGKVGAEGVYALASQAPRAGEPARALALKVEDGAMRAVYPLALALAAHLGLLSDSESASLREVAGLTLRNTQDQVVGTLRARVLG